MSSTEPAKNRRSRSNDAKHPRSIFSKAEPLEIEPGILEIRELVMVDLQSRDPGGAAGRQLLLALRRSGQKPQ